MGLKGLVQYYYNIITVGRGIMVITTLHVALIHFQCSFPYLQEISVL